MINHEPRGLIDYDTVSPEVHISNERLKRVLGWQPRSTEEMGFATGESLIEQGLV